MKRPNHSALAGIAIILMLSYSSCEKENPEPKPVITEFSPRSGLTGRGVTIVGNHFVPPQQVPASTVGDIVVAFNGMVADGRVVEQESIDKQTIAVGVPAGATTGKITVTANGFTATSAEEFTVTFPTYVPNVVVSTVLAWSGDDIEIDEAGTFYLSGQFPANIVKINASGSGTVLWASASSEIMGMARDRNGNIYASIDEGFILRISPDGTATTFAGGTRPDDINGTGTSARFKRPMGIDADENGNLYVADMDSYKVKKITPDGLVTTLAGSARGYADGPEGVGKFESPSNVTVDANGNVFVVDGGRIRKISPDGVVTTVAGNPWSGYRDGPANEAEFYTINGLVTDAGGNLYVVDEGNSVIRRISADGTVATVAGSTYGYADGPGYSALMHRPLGMAINSDGDIFVTQVDNLKKWVRKITID